MTKITFRSLPHIDGDTGYSDPLYRMVEMSVNGKPWLLDMIVSTGECQKSALSCARSGQIRASRFPEEIRSTLGVEPEALISALNFDYSNLPVWVR